MEAANGFVRVDSVSVGKELGKATTTYAALGKTAKVQLGVSTQGQGAKRDGNE